MNSFELSLWLEKMARHHELIIYSILPIKLIRNILSGIKKSDLHISHILSYEDISFFDNFAVKDLSILSEGRVVPNEENSQESDIFII